MKIEKATKDSFAVIGKEGSTREGDGFIQRLWQDANTHFDEIADLAKRDESGNLIGIWGAMTDLSCPSGFDRFGHSWFFFLTYTAARYGQLPAGPALNRKAEDHLPYGEFPVFRFGSQ
jgi:hypothetical protein